MPLVSAINDGFTNAATGDLATTYVEGTTGTITESGGTLRVTPATTAGYSGKETANFEWDLDESSVYVRVVNGGLNSGGSTEARITWYRSDDSHVRYSLNGDGTLYLAATGGTTFVAYDSTNHAWMRFREAGGTTYWETAPDSGGAPGTWTTRRSVANPVTVTGGKLRLTVGTDASVASPGYAEFSKLNGVGPYTLTQADFRARNDDGSESAATWLAAQGADFTHPLSTNLRLRFLVQATGEPAATPFRLDYKKSTDSSYSPVLTAQPSTSLPTVVAVGTVASNAAAISPGLPAGIQTGDILVMVCETNNQAITAAGWTEAPNSPQSDATDATRLTILWCRYDSASPVGTTTSDSGDHQIARIIAIRGCVASGDPWDVTSGGTDTASDTTGSIPGATTTTANCLVLLAASTGQDVTTANRFTAWSNADLSDVTEYIDNCTTAGLGGGIGLAVGGKAAAGAYGATAVTYAAASRKGLWSGALKPAAVAQVPVLMAPSANIGASGAATTQQMTGGTGTFGGGRIQDDENPADAVTFAAAGNTEMEYSVAAVSGVAVDGDIYQFRLTIAGAALDGYLDTPEWTIGTGGLTLAPADLATAHALDAATITQVHVLVPADLSTGHSLDSPSVTQNHVLVPASLATGHTLDASTVAQVHALAPADLAHAHALDASTISQAHVLAPNDAATAHALDTGTITQVHGLTPADLAQAHTLDASTVAGEGDAHTLSAADLGTGHALDAGTLAQDHALSPSDLGTSHALTGSALTQAHALAPADLATTHALEATAVTPETDDHSLSPATLSTAHALDAGTVAQVHGLTPAALGTAHALDTGSIAQTHVVAPADLATAHSTDGSGLGVRYDLSPADLATSHTVESPAVAQVYVLTAAALLHSHGLDSPTITQLHLIVPADLLQGHTLDIGGLQDESLVPPFHSRLTLTSRTPTLSTRSRSPGLTVAQRGPTLTLGAVTGVLTESGGAWSVETDPGASADGAVVNTGDGYAIDDALTSGLRIVVNAGRPYIVE